MGWWIRDGVGWNLHSGTNSVLQTIVLLMGNRVADRFRLMDDNVRPHRARIITTFLEDNEIQRLEWPAMSPDLNHLENIWGILDRRSGIIIHPYHVFRLLQQPS